LRKLAMAAVVAATGVFGVTGVAHAVEADQTLKVTLKSSKAGTKTKPKSVGALKVVITTTPKGTTPPAFATKQAVIHFDKNLIFNSRFFPSCTLAQAQAQAAAAGTACNKAKVGTGSAKAIAGGVVPINDVKVTLFNGPKGKNLWLLVQEPQFNVNEIMRGNLTKDRGAYGKKLVVTIPEALQQTAGLWVTLTEFITNVSSTYKRKPYIALVGCTKGGLKFAGDFTFAPDNSKLHAGSPPQRCKK
jgi:LysM repeat protein